MNKNSDTSDHTSLFDFNSGKLGVLSFILLFMICGFYGLSMESSFQLGAIVIAIYIVCFWPIYMAIEPKEPTGSE